MRVLLLKAGSAGLDPSRLPYGAHELGRHGIEVTWTDEHLAEAGRAGRLQRIVERATTSFDEVRAAHDLAAGASAVLAVFESQGNPAALLKLLRRRPWRDLPLVVVTCWLGEMSTGWSALRRLAYSTTYRKVDRVVVLSRNQRDLLAGQLRMDPERIVVAPFGVDVDAFAPSPRRREDFVLAVGRDRGRDWLTFLDAVDGLDVEVRIACRPGTLPDRTLPANTRAIGVVSREDYRALLASARLGVVPLRPLAYPSGQSVLLESLAAGLPTVVTSTPALADYLDHRAMVVVPGADAASLRAGICSVLDDPAGAAERAARGRTLVEERFSFSAMWQPIAEALTDVAGIAAA